MVIRRPLATYAVQVLADFNAVVGDVVTTARWLRRRLLGADCQQNVVKAAMAQKPWKSRESIREISWLGLFMIYLLFPEKNVAIIRPIQATNSVPSAVQDGLHPVSARKVTSNSVLPG